MSAFISAVTIHEAGHAVAAIVATSRQERPPGGVPSDPITQLRVLLRARKVCQRFLAASFRLAS